MLSWEPLLHISVKVAIYQSAFGLPTTVISLQNPISLFSREFVNRAYFSVLILWRRGGLHVADRPVQVTQHPVQLL